MNLNFNPIPILIIVFYCGWLLSVGHFFIPFIILVSGLWYFISIKIK